MISPPLVRVRDLRKGYSEGEKIRVVLDRLDLDIRRGEVIALLGRSGSGKSTLLNLLSGIDLPDRGEVQIDGQTITALDERARTGFRRRHIGFVFQFFNLIPTLTVQENLSLPLALNGLDDRSHRERAVSLLQQVDLGDRAGSFPERLSGGEQQRLAIIRALVHDPLLLLADEPTGNLDDETGWRVLDLLFALPRQAGTTVLLVTHSREIAARADRMLQLEAGRLREIGP
jgi:putative ABC transport system ATP-binding protein